MDIALPSFVLGYHGCDEALAEDVFAGRAALNPSENDYDWLGWGIYFWEHSPDRAFDFAREVSKRPHHRGQSITTPAVVGAVIDLGRCLNLLDTRNIGLVKEAHRLLSATAAAVGETLPRNTGGDEWLRRDLDCAVIQSLHAQRERDGEESFNTVRAAFQEGPPLYERSGFREKNHIQIAVRTPACIRGYFRPLDDGG